VLRETDFLLQNLLKELTFSPLLRLRQIRYVQVWTIARLRTPRLVVWFSKAWFLNLGCWNQFQGVLEKVCGGPPHVWRSKVKGTRWNKRIYTAYFNTSSTGVRIYSYLPTGYIYIYIYIRYQDVLHLPLLYPYGNQAWTNGRGCWTA